MSGGARNDEADSGSRLPAGSSDVQTSESMPGQRDGRWTLDEQGVWRERPGGAGYVPPRNRRKLGVAAGLGIAGVGGLAAVLILTQLGVFASNKAPAPAAPAGFQPSATKPAQAARQTAEAFLSAWQHGRIRKAASYTDHPDAAAVALTSYHDGLHLRALHLAVHHVTAQGSVTFSVAATVGLPAPAPRTATALWSYSSDLVAYARHTGWWVRWDPAVLAPNLTAGETVATVPVEPGAAQVEDAGGNALQGDQGLDNIAAALMKSAPGSQGTPGIDVAFLGPGNAPVAGTTSVLSQPLATGVVTTTIDPRVEAAAESAVQAHAGSTMVVIQPSSGDILAVANNDGANDFALTARVAPGSTNKIITSTALFTTGLVSSPSQPVDCPPQIDADGEIINNAGGESEPPGTPFITDFAASCNNAFDRWYSSLSPQTLAQTAQKYYGLNQPWDIGVGPGVPYYTLPSSAANNELALELFGQGRLSASPLAMASVAATVDTGTFKQPIVVPGLPQLAGTPLPDTVHQYMWQLMRAVTQGGGTAAGVFDGVSSAVYAKTGTADVSGQGQPNSWLVAFDPTLNVAVGCLVLNAGYGAQVAGPEVASLLQQLG
jgi:Penicillin binding protein transpeptidase domain/NTF2-like N-terminal transpeptidase domain